MPARIKPGDVYAIRLQNGEYAYLQYLLRKSGYGDLGRVFRLRTTEPSADIAAIVASGELFPPVFVGIKVPVKLGRWRLVGHREVGHYPFPSFRISNGTKPGSYEDWKIWDGSSKTHVGALPQHLRSLERRVVWGDQSLAKRIETGHNPYAEVV